MPRIEWCAGRLRRESPLPDLQRRLGSWTARQVELSSPHGEDGAGNGPTQLDVLLVHVQVHGGAGPVVLAEGVDTIRLPARGVISSERARIEAAEGTVPRPLDEQPIEEGHWVAGDLLLWLRIGPGEKVPVGSGNHAVPHLTPDVKRRQDVQQDQLIHPVRLVERQAIADARAAV